MACSNTGRKFMLLSQIHNCSHVKTINRWIIKVKLHGVTSCCQVQTAGDCTQLFVSFTDLNISGLEHDPLNLRSLSKEAESHGR